MQIVYALTIIMIDCEFYRLDALQIMFTQLAVKAGLTKRCLFQLALKMVQKWPHEIEMRKLLFIREVDEPLAHRRVHQRMNQNATVCGCLGGNLFKLGWVRDLRNNHNRDIHIRKLRQRSTHQLIAACPIAT